MARREFKTQEQIDVAEAAMDAWIEKYPAAAQTLQQLWTLQLMQVGHKALGRMLLDKEVLPYEPKE